MKQAPRIWIVDDSPLEAELIRRAVADGEFDASVFLDSSSVVERLALDAAPDVLVLDWLLPGMSGLDVCRFLRANAALRDIPLLMVTARDTEDDLVEALDAGADDYIAKPFAPRALQARLAALLRRRGLPRNASTAREALRALLDCLPNAAVAVDADGMVVLTNRDADSLLRRSGVLAGRAITDFVPDASVGGSDAAVSFADQEIEGRIYAPTLRPLPSTSPAAAAIVFRDVTSHRRLEAALRRSEAHLRAVLDSPIFGVVFWSEGGALTEASDTFLSMIGYTREELAAGAIRWRDLVPAEQVAIDDAAWEEVRIAGSCTPYEREFVRKDGTRVPVLIGVSTSEGLRNRGLAFTVDTSRRHRAESESRARDEFFGMMSHELRTPINAILGWTQMLRAGTLPEESRVRGLAAIERNAHFQARLIEDLLDISRAINGKIDLRNARVDVRTLLETATESIRPLLQSRTLVFETHFGNEPVEVFGDGARLQQVLMNLLTNAVKFTSETGRIEFRARRNGLRLEISVIDDGRGIDPALLPHVFERFRQGSPPEQRRSSGLGLGLTIAQNLVRLHGGTIDALSDGPGFGATFIVTLPVAV